MCLFIFGCYLFIFVLTTETGVGDSVNRLRTVFGMHVRTHYQSNNFATQRQILFLYQRFRNFFNVLSTEIWISVDTGSVYS